MIRIGLGSLTCLSSRKQSIMITFPICGWTFFLFLSFHPPSLCIEGMRSSSSLARPFHVRVVQPESEDTKGFPSLPVWSSCTSSVCRSLCMYIHVSYVGLSYVHTLLLHSMYILPYVSPLDSSFLRVRIILGCRRRFRFLLRVTVGITTIVIATEPWNVSRNAKTLRLATLLILGV